MEFKDTSDGFEDQIIDLFASTFTASEGADEGAVVGTLARKLLRDTPERDLYVFIALDREQVMGAALFSRLSYSDDPRSVFILSPMAVATDKQMKGVGQALLNHALAVLRDHGVAVVTTYGDPAFYGKVGFLPLDKTIAAPPLPLSFPEGWIGQSLTNEPLHPLKGVCTCVVALNDPAIW